LVLKFALVNDTVCPAQIVNRPSGFVTSPTRDHPQSPRREPGFAGHGEGRRVLHERRHVVRPRAVIAPAARVDEPSLLARRPGVQGAMDPVERVLQKSRRFVDELSQNSTA